MRPPLSDRIDHTITAIDNIAYHRTDPDLLWNMVERDLQPLRNFAEQIAKEAKP